ncbi:phosphatase PAP2 family protein [Streptomyces sp. NPDC053048]|uniref:phosphatase PAP2 family protein n=1 Tax=Streptomyces sp. NPDC053048 TaxID=3365694 RepID=UPI0037D7E1E3
MCECPGQPAQLPQRPRRHRHRLHPVSLATRRWRPLALLLGTLFAAGTGLARIYLGVHYLADVIAGALAATGAGLMTTGLLQLPPARARLDALERAWLVHPPAPRPRSLIRPRFSAGAVSRCAFFAREHLARQRDQTLRSFANACIPASVAR